MFRIKIVCLMLIVMVLNGCGGAIDSTSVKAYEKLCEPNGGVETYWLMLTVSAVCTNGAEFNSYDVETITRKNGEPK